MRSHAAERRVAAYCLKFHGKEMGSDDPLAYRLPMAQRYAREFLKWRFEVFQTS
jgi:hypothetical protein